MYFSVEEPVLNSPREQSEEKGFGNSPNSKFNDREDLDNELREAINKMTGRNKVINKNTEPNVE